MAKSKRMRLPNGFGQISEIKNTRLRKPFRAMVTVGKTDEGKPICKPLKPETYFRTYNEAYAALIKYHENPYSIAQSAPMSSVFDEWYSFKQKEGAVKYKLDDFKRLWKYCTAIYSIPIKDVRTTNIRDVIENGRAVVGGTEKGTSPLTQKKLKTMLVQIFDYALSYDMTDKNYAKNYAIPKNITKKFTSEPAHISYSDEEMAKLWQHADDLTVQMVLIQCYSGWRPNELLALQLSDVDIENWTFTGGMKTEAGKDRVVPIHSRIRDLVKRNYDYAQNINSSYLFNRIDGRGKKVTPVIYARYSNGLENIIQELDLNPEHRLHDARKQFATMAKRYKVDEYALKKMIGHAVSDITEKFYTDRDIEWLRTEIEKIK